MVECFQKASVKEFLDCLIFANAPIVDKEFRISGFQKFVKTQRVEIKQINHSDRIRLGLS